LIIRTPIEYCQPAFSRRSKTFVFQKPESARSSLTPPAPALVTAGDQLVGEAQDPLLRVRRPLAQADVQRLTGVRPGGEDRVIAQQPRVPVGGALLQAPADLADEAVDVDHQPPAARARARVPRPLDGLPEQLVELAHVPERKRAQKRPRRRRRRQPAAPNRRVRPALSTSQSSMLSAPSTIAYSSAITLRPTFAAPGRSPRNLTSCCASASTPSRPASVASSITPASETTR
jgi:hypothetical protein